MPKISKNESLFATIVALEAERDGLREKLQAAREAIGVHLISPRPRECDACPESQYDESPACYTCTPLLILADEYIADCIGSKVEEAQDG